MRQENLSDLHDGHLDRAEKAKRVLLPGLRLGEAGAYLEFAGGCYPSGDLIGVAKRSRGGISFLEKETSGRNEGECKVAAGQSWRTRKSIC